MGILLIIVGKNQPKKIMAQILIGPGIHHLVEVEQIPHRGELLNLASAMLDPGVYEMIPQGERSWGNKNYPYFTLARRGNLPHGTRALPMAVLNI